MAPDASQPALRPPARTVMPPRLSRRRAWVNRLDERGRIRNDLPRTASIDLRRTNDQSRRRPRLARAYDEGGGMTAEHQERNHGRSSDGKRRSEGKDFAATAGVGIDSLTSIRNGWSLECQLSSTISSAPAERTANAISALAAASKRKEPRCRCIGAIDPSRKMGSETFSL